MTTSAAPIAITDPADPRVADYLSLTDVALRTRSEPAGGLFIAESELVIRRALKAGYAPRSVLVGAKRLPFLPAELTADVPVYLAADDVLVALTGYHVHRGALAAFHRRPLPAAADLLASARRLVILEDVVSHTNLGAIFRGAAGLGMDAVLLSPSCADPLYRRSVRVSMGVVFAVPYARLEPWPGGLDAVRAAGFRVLALTPDPAALPLDELTVDRDDRLALVLGSEGPGLSAGALGGVDQPVRIPMAHGVDSLNVAAATAVACYVVGRH